MEVGCGGELFMGCDDEDDEKTKSFIGGGGVAAAAAATAGMTSCGEDGHDKLTRLKFVLLAPPALFGGESKPRKSTTSLVISAN